MSYYKLIQLINNPKKQINNIVFSPHHIRSKCIAFGKVNFSANNKYELFAYNGITTYGYFKFNNDLYIIVVEFPETLKLLNVAEEIYTDGLSTVPPVYVFNPL